jgi:hypothetical protein
MIMKTKTIKQLSLILATCMAIFLTGCDDNSTPSGGEETNEEQILFGPGQTQIGNGMKMFQIKKSHTIKKGVYSVTKKTHHISIYHKKPSANEGAL